MKGLRKTGADHGATRPAMRLRRANGRDLDALVALENRVFTADIMSRRSFRRFLASPHAVLRIAEQRGRFAGYVLVLFRPVSGVARLYSIAVAPDMAGRGVGRCLLAAAEKAAIGRRCTLMRLEVQDRNTAAIARYAKSGYRLLGRRRHYYDDGGDALRYEKDLA
jgi:ribosomal protein S18 acetylase RimI-like enzyme